MGFLAPAWLLLALLAALIVWLHLRRRIVRIREVSSTLIWKRVAENLLPTTPRKPPPLNAILLLQLLFLLLTALALARPVLGFLGGNNQHVIYVLDASGSTQATDIAPNRFAVIKDRALAGLRVRRESSSNLASIVVASPSPWIAAARQTGTTDLERSLMHVQGTQGPARWDRVRSLIQSLRAEGEETRVLFLSDGSDREMLAGLSDLKDVQLEPHAIVAKGVNLGFSSVQLIPPAKGFRRTKVTGEIRQFGSEKPTAAVEVYFWPQDGKEPSVLTTQKIPLARNRAATFDFFFTLSGTGVIELRLPEDTLEQDNHAYFALQKEPLTLRVLHIGKENPPVQRALQAIAGIELFNANTLPADARLYDLVIVDGVKLEKHPQTSTLWLGVVPPNLSEIQTLPDPYPSGWRDDHPLSLGVNWSSLEVRGAREFARLPGAEVLLEASNHPLVQARTNGYGREVVTAFGLEDSNWTEQPSFPAFILNLTRWIEPGVGSSLSPPCRVGMVCPLDPRLLSGDWQLVDPQNRLVPLRAAFVKTDATGDARTNQWLPRNLESLFRPEQSGVYTLVSGSLRKPIAVNAFGSESDIRSRPTSTNAGAQASATPRPLWTWLLLLALILLLVESWLSGRQYDGFLIPRNLLSHNPLSRRRRWMLGLQALSLLCGLLALLEVRLPLPTRESTTVVVADRPELHSGRSAQAIEQTLRQVKGNTSVVWLGSQAQLGNNPPKDKDQGANLQAALSLAAALIPSTSSGNIVLVSEGLQTRGQAVEALPQLVNRNLPLDVQPIGGIPSGEVFVERLQLPASLHAGDAFVLQAVLFSQLPKPATVRILRDGQAWAERKVNLQAGHNRLELNLREARAGTYRYDLELQATGDTFAENNRQSTLVQIGAAPKVVLYTLQEYLGQVMQRALGVQGLSVEIKNPADAPKNLEGWAEARAAVLLNVPATRFTFEQQNSLEAWVRDHGGGLLMLGGENSFGPGGYYRTALDRLSPVSSKIPQEAPKVAMLFLLDKSGSMNQPTGNASSRRVDVAREAILEAIGLLHPESLSGVVAFDTRAEVAVPIQSVQNKAEFASRLQSLQTGGGTALYPALLAAYQEMRGVDSLARHVVLLSDGLSEIADFDSVVTRMAQEGITLSTVAVGEGADLTLVEKLARLGRGASHITTDWQALPGILSQEALLLSATPVKKKSFAPVWVNHEGKLVEGWPDALPVLGGYVQTTPKPAATLHLIGPDQAPILASWRYGLGQVIAFTSQGAGEWANAWTALPSFPYLWGQMLHQVLQPTIHPGLNLQTRWVGDELLLQVEALQTDTRPHTALKLEATLSSPSGQPQSMVLQEVWLGHYEASRILDRQGRYTVEVKSDLQENPPQPVRAEVFGPQAVRYAFDTQGSDLLSGLAQVTGGRVRLGGEALKAGQPPLRWVWRPAWMWFGLLGLGVFLGGLVVRYLPDLVSRRGKVGRVRVSEG